MADDRVIFIVVDDPEIVNHVFEKKLPLSDLLGYVCVDCGKDLFVTRKQYDAYKRHAPNKTVAFRCAHCYCALVKVKRERDTTESN
jgi:hypothetical protein